jgi:polysaccharide deacetylase family protein (PEP-CTERM system associated)
MTSPSQPALESIFSVDVEDWFHILDVPATPPPAAWDGLPSRVEANFRRLLDLLEESGVRATCFFLGYVAARFPALVREAARRGHEVASHGHEHQLVHRQTRAEFLADVTRAKHVLEDILGAPVDGYRSPGFSLTEETGWFFEALIEAGYRYDSSVFPAAHGHGGLRAARTAPHWRHYPSGRLGEFPISVAEALGRRMCFFGGGYLRLFPYPAIRRMARRVEREGRPVVFYIHPREIDPAHPRLPMGPARRFKSYVGLSTTEPKLRRIFRDFRLTTCRDFLSRHGDELADERFH